MDSEDIEEALELGGLLAQILQVVLVVEHERVVEEFKFLEQGGD